MSEVERGETRLVEYAVRGLEALFRVMLFGASKKTDSIKLREKI